MNRIAASVLRLLPVALLPFAPLACGGDDLSGPDFVRTQDGRLEIRGSDWIQLSKSYHSFGPIWHGDVPTHTFRVRNTSDQSIRLTAIRNACTCAYVVLRIVDRNGDAVGREIHQPPIYRDGGPMITWLEPSEVLEAEVVVDTLTLPAKDHKEPGETILYFEPAEAGNVRFAYDIDIHARVRIDPGPQIVVPEISKYQRRPILFELYPGQITPDAPPQRFQITKIEGLDDTMQLEELAPTRQGGYRYLLEVGPVSEIGPYERILSFHTDLPAREAGQGYVARIQVAGTIVPALRLTPQRDLNFGRIRFDEPARQFLLIEYLRPGVDPGLRLGVLEARGTENEDLSAHFTPVLEAEADGGQRLQLRYDGKIADPSLRRFQGRLLLRTNDPDHETLWIPILGFRRD